MKFPNPEKTDLVLRRQGEHVEQRPVAENKVENFYSDNNEVEESISERSNENSVPRSPCKEKECMSNLYVSTSSSRSKIAKLKADGNIYSASHVVTSNRLNGVQRTLFSFESSFVDNRFGSSIQNI
jgi:hypothetical protein